MEGSVSDSAAVESCGDVLRVFKKRKRPLAEIGSPSSCVTLEARRRIAFRDPGKSPSSRRLVTVLLPNNTKLFITSQDDAASCVCTMEEFLVSIQRESEKEFEKMAGSNRRNRQIRWGPNIYLEDSFGNRIVDDAALRDLLLAFATILVQDGETDTKHTNEWDITPEPKMLGRLPQGYNVETALADEVDNALQAVWNINGRRRLICVEVQSSKISIFDTGLGMDAQSIKYWGKPGGSSHREVHMQAIGGTPPFLKPFLGKYGAGGVAAALHLGSFVTVSSKTMESQKVVTLDLSKDDLDKRWRLNQDHWLTPGQLRDMTSEERKRAPGGSFTLVEISKLKRHYTDLDKEIFKTKCLLADIYYNYIHSEEFGVANRALKFPIEFEVNGQNLAEVVQCETATLIQHTCNGAAFVIDLSFSGPIEDPDEAERIRSRNKSMAHARVTCNYFPNLKGKEELDAVIEELAHWKVYKKNFDNYPRVAVRWLGRLLPENGWESFPFMKVAVKRMSEGWKIHWAKRVRANIVLDAGFHPTQSKTQLERDHPFTVALQYLGDPDGKKKSSAADVEVVIKVGGKILNSKQLNDEYMHWLKRMHDTYDEEVEFLDENPTYICDQPIHEALGLNRDLKNYAIVFYKHMRDFQGNWKVSNSTPLHVKIPKAASHTCSDLYATIEWFYCQGTGGDDHGEVKMIVRPIDVPKEQGSEMKRQKNEKLVFSLKNSRCLSWTLPKNLKLQRLTLHEWTKKEAELANKAPSHIEVLNDRESKALNCDQTLPTKLSAGSKLPEFLVVVRPKSGSGASFKQQMVHPKACDMKLRVCREGSSSTQNSSVLWEGTVRGDHVRNHVKGLYSFDPKALGFDDKLVKLGTYHLRFELTSTECQVKPLNWTIKVSPSTESKGWRVHIHKESSGRHHPSSAPPLNIRLNEPLTEELHFTKPDIYDNLQSLSRIPILWVSLNTSHGVHVLSGTSCNSENLALSPDKQCLILKKKVLFCEGKLGPLGPTYEGRLVFHIEEDAGSKSTKESTTELKCRVYPGQIATTSVIQGPALQQGPPISFAEPMRPNEILELLRLKGSDVSGNAVEKGQRVEVRLENLQFLDKIGPIREVAHNSWFDELVSQKLKLSTLWLDEQGTLDLGGLLKVTGPYNSRGSIIILCRNLKGERTKLIELLVTVASCRLEIVHPVRRNFPAGSTLEGVIVEIIGTDGLVDTTMDGPYHTLTLDWVKNITCPIIKGRCELPSFELPSFQVSGRWCGQICHTSFKDLKINLELNLEPEIACRLTLPAEYRTVTARNDEVVVLKFVALGGRGQPAALSADIIDNMIIDVEPNSCSVTWSKIVEISGVRPSYEVHVQLGGKEGKYTVALRSSPDAYPAVDLQQQPGSTALVAWRLDLVHGNFAHLDYQIMKNGALRNLNSIEVPRLSEFPEIHVQVWDAYSNTCLLHDNQDLNLVLEKQDSPGGSSVCGTCKISNGRGVFQPFEMEAEEGSYHLIVKMSSFIFPRGSATPKEPRVNLSVTPGNHPAALRLLFESPLEVVLSTEVQFLKSLTVVIEPVDIHQPLRRLKPPVMVLVPPGRSQSSCIQEYIGETVAPLDELPGSKAYKFAQIVAPTIAGKYSLRFVVRDHEIITPCLCQLIVKQAPPARLDLRIEQSEKKGPIVKARIMDVHGNICTGVNSLILNLTLNVSDERVDVRGIQRSCFLISQKTAMVESGVGNFEQIELSQGRPGLYILKVFVEPDQKLALGPLGYLVPSELQMLVSNEALMLQLEEDLHSKRESVKSRKLALSELKRRLDSLREESSLERGKLEKLRQEKMVCTNVGSNDQDGIILRHEKERPRRGEGIVWEELDSLARRRTNAAAALAFLEARQGGKFLSPNGPLAGEAVGLPVTLARVENEDFNRILCEFMSPGTLMLPICKSQEGVNALQRRVGGVVDSSYGLANVSRYPLDGFYDVFALSDSRTWLGSIDQSHPQLLLNIPPPWVPGNNILESQVPRGFLGYAVNLLHIREEHLKMRFKVTAMSHRLYGLRETLFYHLLQKVQVYDTRENMNMAKQLKALDGGAMSLDGYLIRSNMRQQLGTPDRNHSPISFALVSFEERLATCGLLPPACDALKRCKLQRSDQQSLELQLQQVKASYDQKLRASESLFREITEAEKCLQYEEAKEKEVQGVASRQQGLQSSLDQSRQPYYNIRVQR